MGYWGHYIFDNCQNCFWDRQATFCYNIHQPCYKCWSHLTHLPYMISIVFIWKMHLALSPSPWSAVDWERQVVVIIHFYIYVILNMHSKKRLISSQIEFDELWILLYPQKRKNLFWTPSTCTRPPKQQKKTEGCVVSFDILFFHHWLISHSCVILNWYFPCLFIFHVIVCLFGWHQHFAYEHPEMPTKRNGLHLVWFMKYNLQIRQWNDTKGNTPIS